MTLREQIESYIPYNEQEERDKEQFLRFIDENEDVLTRENIIGHFSSSAFVVNKNRDKMLVVYHLINDGWIAPGGHADGEDDLLSVAHREVQEETGLDAKILDENIFAIQSAPVIGHVKKGKYVSAHIHFDCLYLMEADDSIPLIFRPDESKGVKWIPFNEAYGDEIVPWARPMQKKLVMKINERK